MKKTILVIDDDHYIINLLENFLKREGYKIFTLGKGKPALDLMREETIDLVLCDIRLPDIDGTELLTQIKRATPDIPVIMMTAYAEIRTAVETIKSGAYDYVTKPIFPEEISAIIKKALRKKLALETASDQDFITGNSPLMLQLIDQSKLVAPTDMSVLIQGETGSGKEYVARLIHNHSRRKGKGFVAIDCGAIPKELAASELFGHIKGSFTGAVNNKSGYFEQANGGTIFLDEIGNLSYETQVKLLRAIQQKVISRVGDTKIIPIDVRLISASNRNLMEAVAEGQFREDLYHRLNEFKVELPPLRKRGDDILIFTQHFLDEANGELNKEVKGLDEEVAQIFKNYAWFGNLRELRNVVKRSVLIARGEYVTRECLPGELMQQPKPATISEAIIGESFDLKDATHEAEKLVVERALREANYNKSLAAKILKIDRKTLYNKINQLGIEL
ncbi:MAG: sigma-54-dependent Fis family transcriptional regulator [Clostridia bacterium]|nr:sigma-54-dependent Fis family transcriptional regulator [Clostridia bacterium]